MNPVTGTAPTFFANNQDVVIKMAYLNQTGCDNNSQDTNANNNCLLLNAAAAYQNFGLVRVDNSGTYTYMNTRNNNFSNRE